ncbi:hypothetical protein A9Z42_0011260 [Trichoderma parareesei]|uniref:NWD NACHT-NTPase N-terminal domain-containing protein n=1 Tax=Trichoderma parareesei TaxID=858221 RepID=A0A2H2YYB1_TRIPA|nr:hypothetical protein A9Z42_0011260 [Trichoderma parareesei]
MKRFWSKDKANQPSHAAGDEAGISGRSRRRDQFLSTFDRFSLRGSSRPKSVDRSSRFQPSLHHRATSVPAIHKPRTPSDANDTPGPELSPDAADTSVTAESVSHLEDLTRIDIPTGQEHPVTQGSHKEAITPQGLWDEAYDKLKSEQPELMKGYETILSNMLQSPDDADDLGQVTIKSTSDDRRAQLLEVIRSSQKKIEKEGKVKENIGQILSVISSLNSTIQTAIQAAPQAALPWSIVSLSLEFAPWRRIDR